MNKAEQLIACLEGEIAKRDEELAACRVAVENCEVFRARIAELEARIVWLECEAQVNAAPVSEAKAQGVVMPEHETSTPSSKWASAGEPDPHGKTYDCERAELSMGEYTDDELANAVFMHDHRSFDIAATMRGEPGSIVLLTAAKERIRWLSRSLYKALACLNAATAAPAADAGLVDMYRHLQTVTPYRFKKIQDASITDGGDVMYFHKDRFDAALLADMAAHCAAPATADSDVLECGE